MALQDLRSTVYVACLCIAAASSEAVHADIVALHSGSTDPTTEGWVRTGGGGVIEGPLNDGGTEAWSVADHSSANGSFLFYSKSVTAGQALQAASLGWSLSARMRVPFADDPSKSASPFVNYLDGAREWALGFEVSGSDVIVKAVTGVSPQSETLGPTYTIPGGMLTFNTYEVRYDASAMSADLYVDGVERISNFVGNLVGSSQSVAWGAGASSDIGRGNFNSVSFSISAVPEIGSARLIGAASLLPVGCLWMRRRKQRASR